MALGVVAALKDKGMKDKVMVGVDFIEEAKASSAGELDATVAMFHICLVKQAFGFIESIQDILR